MENIQGDIYIDPVQTNILRTLLDDLIARFRQLESNDNHVSSSSSSYTTLSSSFSSSSKFSTLTSTSQRSSASSSSSSLTSTTNGPKRAFSTITNPKELYAEVLRLVLRDMCMVPIKVQLPESLKPQQQSSTGQRTATVRDGTYGSNYTMNNGEEDDDDANNLYVDIAEDWESEAIDKGWSKSEVRHPTTSSSSSSSSSTSDVPSGSPYRRIRKDTPLNETTPSTTRSSSPERSVFSSEQQKSSHHYIRKLATELTNTTAVLKDYAPTIDKPLQYFTNELGYILYLVQKVSQDNLLDRIEEDMGTIRQAKHELIHKSQTPSHTSSDHGNGATILGSKRNVDGHGMPSSTSATTTLSSSTSTTTPTAASTTTPQSSGRFGISALFPALGRSPSRSVSTNRSVVPSSSSHTVTSPYRDRSTGTAIVPMKPVVPFIADTSFEQRFTNASDLLRTVCRINVNIIQRWPQILHTLQQICEIFISLSETYLQKSQHCTERYNAVSVMLQEAITEKSKIDTRLINAVTVAKLQSSSSRTSGTDPLTLTEALSMCLDFIMVHGSNKSHTAPLSSTPNNYNDKQVQDFMEITTERSNLLTQIETLTSDQENCQAQKLIFNALSDLVLCAREYAVISCIRAQISLQRALMETLFFTDSVSIEWLISLLEWSGSEEKKRLLAQQEIQDKQEKLQNYVQYFGNTAPQSQADTLAQINEMEQVVQNSELSVNHVFNVCMDIGKYSLSTLPLELRQCILQRLQVVITSTDLSKALDIDIFANRLRTSAAEATTNLGNDNGNGSSTVSTPTSLSSFMDTNIVQKGAFKLRSYPSVRHMHLRTLLIPVNESIVWGSAVMQHEKNGNNTSTYTNYAAFLSEGERIKCLLLARTGIKPIMSIISQPSIQNLRNTHTDTLSTTTGTDHTGSMIPTFGTLFDTLSIMAPGPPLPEIETIDEDMNNTPQDNDSRHKRKQLSTGKDKGVSSGNKRARRDDTDDDNEKDNEDDQEDDDEDNDNEEEEDKYDHRRKSNLSSNTAQYSGQKRRRPYGGDGPGGRSSGSTTSTNGSKYFRSSNTKDGQDNDGDGNETDGTVDSEASESGACIIM